MIDSYGLLVQGLQSDGLQDHLTVLAECLNKVWAKICPPEKKASKIGEILPGLAALVDKEHKRLLARKSIIEKRKEEQELLLLEMVHNSFYLGRWFQYLLSSESEN